MTGRGQASRSFSLGLLLVCLVVAGWIWLRGDAPGVRPTGEVGGSVGDRAPRFRVADIDGRETMLAGDRPTLIYIMAAWCGTCIPEERALARLHERYGEGVRIITVDADPVSDTEADLRAFRDAYGGPWPHVLDRENAIVIPYGVRLLDTTFIIDRRGMVAYRDERPTPYEDLHDALERVLDDG